MKIFLTHLGLLKLAYEDYHAGEVNIIWALLLCDINYYKGYILLILSYSLYKYWKNYIGEADIIIICLLLTRFSLLKVNKMLMLASISGLISLKVSKKQKLHFIPHLYLGFLGGLYLVN